MIISKHYIRLFGCATGVTVTLFSGRNCGGSESWENQHGRGGSVTFNLFLFSVEFWYKKDK